MSYYKVTGEVTVRSADGECAKLIHPQRKVYRLPLIYRYVELENVPESADPIDALLPDYGKIIYRIREMIPPRDTDSIIWFHMQENK